MCLCYLWNQFSQFSRSVVSDSLRPHGLQHARLPCPSPTLGVYPNTCPLSRWCHPTISPSVVSFSSHLQSFPASGSFQMSRFITSGGQSIGVSASASVLPLNIQDWCPLGWPGWISSPTSRREHLPSLPSFVLDLEVLGFMAWLSINWILHPPFLGGLQPSQSNQVLIHVLKRNIMCHSSWTKSTASLLPDV